MNHWQISLAVKRLKAGGVIAYPTESVYGLGCDASNLAAIAKLLTIKSRSYKKGLIVLVSDVEQACPLLMPLSVEQKELINQPSTRATTWLIDRHPDLSPLLVGKHNKLAVRVTGNPVARRLCELLGTPIVSTSCNVNGKPASQRVSQVRNKMLLKLDKIVNGSCCGQQPSRIVDLASGIIVRE